MSDATTNSAETDNAAAAGPGGIDYRASPVIAEPVSATSDDPFSHLYKMSTTAGLGSGDYVAINGLAIASLVLGLASAVVLGDSWVLLLVPIAGLVCAVLSLIQVSRSNGTQTGRGIAVLGLLLSLAFGGFYVARSAYEGVRQRADQQAIVDLVHGFGTDLAGGNLGAAYARCDPEFKSHVSPDLFDSTLRPMKTSPVLGTFMGIDWNGILTYSTDVSTGEPLADGMVFLNYSQSPRPMRIAMGFKKVDGRWAIDQMPSLITPPKPKKAGPPPKQKLPFGPELPAGG